MGRADVFLLIMAVLMIATIACQGSPSTDAGQQTQADLEVTTWYLPDGMVGVPYSVTLEATGGKSPYCWYYWAGSLPPGLSLSKSGVISGIPNRAEDYHFAVKCTDNSSKVQYAIGHFGLTVVGGQPPIPPVPTAVPTTPTHAGMPATPAPTTPAGRGPNEVWIVVREFRPATITVPVGTTVIWISKDTARHTITSATSIFDTPIDPFGSFSYTFTERGTLNYYCVPHDGMTGTVIVE